MSNPDNQIPYDPGSHIPYGASALSTPPNPRGRTRSEKWYDPDHSPPDAIWRPHFQEDEWRQHVGSAANQSQSQLRTALEEHRMLAKDLFQNREDKLVVPRKTDRRSKTFTKR